VTIAMRFSAVRLRRKEKSRDEGTN
jgi:hypothetical protein